MNTLQSLLLRKQAAINEIQIANYLLKQAQDNDEAKWKEERAKQDRRELQNTIETSAAGALGGGALGAGLGYGAGHLTGVNPALLAALGGLGGAAIGGVQGYNESNPGVLREGIDDYVQDVIKGYTHSDSPTDSILSMKDTIRNKLIQNTIETSAAGALGGGALGAGLGYGAGHLTGVNPALLAALGGLGGAAIGGYGGYDYSTKGPSRDAIKSISQSYNNIFDSALESIQKESALQYPLVKQAGPYDWVMNKWRDGEAENDLRQIQRKLRFNERKSKMIRDAQRRGLRVKPRGMSQGSKAMIGGGLGAGVGYGAGKLLGVDPLISALAGGVAGGALGYNLGSPRRRYA